METHRYVRDLIDPAQDFDGWYVDLVRKAELADDAPVRGMKVVRPYAYAIWERIMAGLDARFKATGVENASFPLLIPKSMLEREAEHIEGFTPEVAWVTHAGLTPLEEPLAVRPTSEAIVCPMFASWVQSWRDLPIVLNQWGSVVRWEDRPRAFLRTSEFLWQEGHTCHATAGESAARAHQMVDLYAEFLQTELAIPTITGRKSESEKFAGAHETWTVEAMMGGKRWALQAGTAHDLADRFGKVFDIRFVDRHGERRYAFNTSWGMSQRTIGAVIMVHGDERGLRLPPRIAPVQAVIVPIAGRHGDGQDVLDAAHRLRDRLAPAVRVRVDDRDDRSPGYKFNHWELRGVPVRIELGPRDLKASQAILVRRDTGEKAAVTLDAIEESLASLLVTIQQRMLDDARTTLKEHTVDVRDYATLRERIATNAGFSRVWWDGDASSEAKLKAGTKATIRCIPSGAEPGREDRCVISGNPARHQVIVARAY